MPNDTPDPLYYLRNFERALAWLAERYADLLADAEHAWLHTFVHLPEASRALLVRMLMRKGVLFRTSRLAYREIGCTLAAAAPLIEAGWVDADAPLTLDELFDLSTRAELLSCFAAQLAGVKTARKYEWLAPLRIAHADPRPYAQWHPQADERVLRVNIAPLCDRLRLMFFGNLHQDWSEFVLSDLGVHQYEPVAFAPSSRAFQQRADVDIFLALHTCGDALDALGAVDMLDKRDHDVALETLLCAVDAIATDNPWLATRRAKLLYRIGYHAERRGQWAAAIHTYARCAWPGARHRRIRALERAGRADEALTLAQHAAHAPESEEESQRVARMLPRLQRRVGVASSRSPSSSPMTRALQPASESASQPASHPASQLLSQRIAAHANPVERSALTLTRPAASLLKPTSVEYVVLDHLSAPDVPVYYVENGLINSLFGLLCWEPVFAALPGAFFHPFQRGPADLHAPDFHAKRAPLFDACLAQLDNSSYRTTIVRHFESKAGRQSPFVFWNMLTRELLDLALDCIPAVHLKRFCERLLCDIRGNRSGLPDLIRFWPRERRYELIEVKGPGDRLQDNQLRWLSYCHQHGIPVRVLDVRWDERCDGGPQPERNAVTSTGIANTNANTNTRDMRTTEPTT